MGVATERTLSGKPATGPRSKSLLDRCNSSAPPSPLTTPGKTSWDGYLDGLSERERLELMGLQLELRLPNGQTGGAVLGGHFRRAAGNGRHRSDC